MQKRKIKKMIADDMGVFDIDSAVTLEKLKMELHLPKESSKMKLKRKPILLFYFLSFFIGVCFSSITTYFIVKKVNDNQNLISKNEERKIDRDNAENQIDAKKIEILEDYLNK